MTRPLTAQTSWRPQAVPGDVAGLASPGLPGPSSCPSQSCHQLYTVTLSNLPVPTRARDLYKVGRQQAGTVSRVWGLEQLSGPGVLGGAEEPGWQGFLSFPAAAEEGVPCSGFKGMSRTLQKR